MLIKFSPRLFNWLTCPATRRGGLHDLFNANLGGKAVSSRHTVGNIALGDDTDKI